VEAHSEAIVTGDKHSFRLGNYEGITIMRVTEIFRLKEYFTPRPLIRAIVNVMQPKPGITIMDPAAGTGGFLLAAHEYISKHYASEMDAEEKRFLKLDALRGIEIVDAAARLCAMNLFLHGVGGNESPHPRRR